MRLPLPVASTPNPTPTTTSTPATTTSTPVPHQLRKVRNVAHRGASAQVAENTLAALRRAIGDGADMVEVDVQRTRDGALVLMHDTTLERTTDAARVFPHRAPWRVADFTLDEIRRLEAGSWKSAVFHGEPVPTLTEAVDVLRHSGTGLLLELKAPRLYPGIVHDVVGELCAVPEYLHATLPAGRLVVQSFDFAAMKDHKTRAPEIPVGLLGAPSTANLPALASWADQVNPAHLSVDKTYVDEVHRLGLECFMWTVNRGPAMRRALRIGVDGIITNRPGHLGRLLATRP